MEQRQLRVLTSIPNRFRLRPFPDPAGIGVTGILKARIGSLCSARPFMSSCSVPSPETDRIVSYSSRGISDATFRA